MRERKIVLIGGGHAHVHVLAAFGIWREPNIHVTVVARDRLTPYSGMLPGVMAGHYTPDEAHIDLARLAAASGATLIEAEACGLDREARLVKLRDGRLIPYDFASIDVGITPDLQTIDGAAKHAIAVKPIGGFLAKFDTLRAQAAQPGGPRRMAIVGGGAAGIELILSLRERLIRDVAGAPFSFVLATSGDLLPTHNLRVRKAMRRILGEKAISLREHFHVARIGDEFIESREGERLSVDCVFISTPAKSPEWLASTGLDVNAGGFLSVCPTLQCTNDSRVFAAGDCANMVDTPREKAGVYAVRAGPPLARNLRRVALGQMPAAWRPQTAHLSLISTGDRFAVASRGWFKAEGAWLWTLKSWIDRRWMAQYRPE